MADGGVYKASKQKETRVEGEGANEGIRNLESETGPVKKICNDQWEVPSHQ